MHLRFTSLAAIFSLLACSSSTNNTPATTEDTSAVEETGDEDTGGTVEDSGEPDTSGGTDTGTASETAPGDSSTTEVAPDVSTTCTVPGAVESEDCGKCGKRARLCDAGKWLPWGACTGEKGVCTPAEKRDTTCGKCGKRVETCSATCGWEPGACTDEGLCNAGDTESQFGACPVAKQVKIRTCSATCAWSDWSACTAPKGWNDIAAAPATFYGRQYHSAAWTGTEMFIFGGQSSGSSYANDAAAYNPTTDTWRAAPAAPITGRYYATAVWAGNQVIVWGGYGTPSPYSKADGAAWDPATNTWAAVPAAPIGARDRHTAVWTGTEMIIWGGYLSSVGTYLADGAAYNPTTKVWRPIAAAPLAGRYDHSAVYAGGKMIVFGGRGTGCTSGCGDGAAYDPVANTWASLSPPSTDLDARYQTGAVTDSGKAIFWGGYGSYISLAYTRNTGAIFDTATSTWKPITPVPLDAVMPYPRRYLMSMWSTPSALFVWGGYGYHATSSSYLSTNATGAYFEYATSTWRAMSDTNAPTARYNATAVWTGSEAIIWGGYSYKNDGKIYRP